MGGCCSSRDHLGALESMTTLGIGEVPALPTDKRGSFKAELAQAIDRNHLQNEVLSQQQVLDFESYKVIMGLISAYQQELSILRNQATFPQRQALLKKSQEEGLPEE